MIARPRFRWLLFVMSVTLIGGALPMAHQRVRAQAGDGATRVVAWSDYAGGGRFSAAFTEVTDFREGTIGQVSGVDTPADPAGRCATDRSVSPARMAIQVDFPSVRTSGNTAQTVGVELALFQYQPSSGDQFTLVYVSDRTYVTVNPGSAVDPGDLEITGVPVGPTFLAVVGVYWYNELNQPPTGAESGFAAFRVDNYAVFHNGAPRATTNACYALVNPYGSLTPTSGPVKTTVTFRLYYFPIEVPFVATWDGKPLPTTTTMTDFNGRATGTFRVPDGQVMGDHTVRFIAGEWQLTRTFTITPRILVTPSTVQRGDTVSISLRGYKAGETVRIRWRDGNGTWREIARVAVSSTGSKTLSLSVPLFAPTGANAVRGDSVNTGGGRAQTNGVTVTGGPFQPAESTPKPTVTPTPTATPTMEATPSPTLTPEVPTPTSEPTIEPTIEPTLEPTLEPTVEPTVAPTEEPTVEPTEEPTLEPTAEPTSEPIVEAPPQGEGESAP